MPNNTAKRSRGVRLTPETADSRDEDDDADDLNFRPAHWPRRRRSKKNPNDLDILKADLLRQVPIGPDGKKLKVTHRAILDTIFNKNPNNATPQGLLALIDLLEEFNPLPNPTIAELLKDDTLNLWWDREP